MNSNAYDYLREFCNSKNCNIWLSNVIKKFIVNNGNLTKEDEKNFAESLINGNWTIEDIEHKDTKIDNKNKKIVITKLLHISGVNALQNNQEIAFCPEINIIYGLNGTGKSGYFRILNEITGGAKEKHILKNIYDNNPKDISIELEYKINDEKDDNILKWNNESRGIEDFKTVRVFDSSYTEGLLKKRDSDELLMKPYELYIFSELIDEINNIIELARIKIDNNCNSKPEIDMTNFSDDTKLLFLKKRFEQEDREYLLKIISDFQNISNEFKKNNEEIEKLRKTNIEDGLKLEKEHKDIVEKLQNKIKSIIEIYNDLIKNVRDTLDKYIVAKKEYKNAQKLFSAISSLPGANSDSWKDFISSAEKYKKENHINSSTCPYCHRKYDDSANNLVKEYSNFLEDKKKEQLDIVESEIKNIRQAIITSDEVKKEEYDFSYLPKSIKQQCEQLRDNIDNVKNVLLKELEDNQYEKIEEIQFDFKDIINYISSCDSNIEKYSLNSEEKKKKLDELNDKMKLYQEKISIINQKDKINDFIKITNCVYENNERLNSINTKKISEISKKAHNELLTEKLKSEFEKILNELNINKLSITLKAQNNKGMQQTELVINNNKNVNEILSEGEQKATALALFLAEISLSNNQSTIIFDDPVNSLDHKMMENFAEKILKMNNQIIIFTHNKMFLDCFLTSSNGHICKNYHNGCNKNKGKHIFLYETKSEGRNSKGIIVEKAQENAKYYLNRAMVDLEKTTFNDNNVCINIRHAVECIIDEVIFNNQVPTRFSTKNNRINWNELKNINNDFQTIDKLKIIHDRVSSGSLHNGEIKENNPVEKEEVIEMINNLYKILERTL